jgi:hypothetical protein
VHGVARPVRQRSESSYQPHRWVVATLPGPCSALEITPPGSPQFLMGSDTPKSLSCVPWLSQGSIVLPVHQGRSVRRRLASPELLDRFEDQMRTRRLVFPRFFQNDTYYKQHGVHAAAIAQADWRKSSLSGYNGSCFEVARLSNDRLGVRDTKDKGSGPVLIFNESEWAAFLGGAKAGEFDSL